MNFCARSCSAPPLAAARAPGRPGGRAGPAGPLLPLRRLEDARDHDRASAGASRPGSRSTSRSTASSWTRRPRCPDGKVAGLGHGAVSGARRAAVHADPHGGRPAGQHGERREPRDRARAAPEAAARRAVAARALHRPRLHRRRRSSTRTTSARASCARRSASAPAQGPCGRIDVRRRQIPIKQPATGRWTLQVDNQQAYSTQPVSVFVRLAITVRARPAARRLGDRRRAPPPPRAALARRACG